MRGEISGWITEGICEESSSQIYLENPGGILGKIPGGVSEDILVGIPG